MEAKASGLSSRNGSRGSLGSLDGILRGFAPSREPCPASLKPQATRPAVPESSAWGRHAEPGHVGEMRRLWSPRHVSTCGRCRGFVEGIVPVIKCPKALQEEAGGPPDVGVTARSAPTAVVLPQRRTNRYVTAIPRPPTTLPPTGHRY